MRAFRTRAFLCAAVVLTAPLASCSKNKAGTNVNIADDGQSGESARTGRGDDGRDVDRGPIEKIELSGSITEVGDMLDAGSKLINMWSPPEPGAPPIDLRNLLAVTLIQEGFGPGFLESINIDGVHAAEFGIPHEGQSGMTESDVDIAVSLATIDAARVVESMPAGMQPQPLGDNIWQLTEENLQILFRAQQAALEIALSREGLDLAHSLPAKVVVGPSEPRFKLTAANLPSADIDVSDLIPLQPGLARTLGSIINEVQSVELAADFGTDRDLIARARLVAPFHRLGLDPIGPASQSPSKLAKALPDGAMATWVMPWGDPKLLHDMLDKQIPVDQIPAPFDKRVGDVVKGAHGILQAISGEVLAAAYVEKSKFTLVLAAEVSDEKAARDATRAVFAAAEQAFLDHVALTGSSPEHTYKVAFKKDAVKVGKAKGDLFTLTVPKSMSHDIRNLGWFFGEKKPQLEVATVVADNKLIIAIGVGQKALLGDIGRRLGKAKDDGLESGGGLALARKLAQGCQYCIALDPVELGEMAFTVIAGNEKEPAEVHKVANGAVKKLTKLGLDGQIAFALRFEQAEGVVGGGVPKSLLFADPAKVKIIVELFESIDEAREKAWATQVGASKRP